MAHYAFLNNENIVLFVIVGRNEDELNTDWEEWYGNYHKLKCKRTSYNTYAGTHNNGGEPFRKNYAGIGFFYDEIRDAFIPPKSFDSWVLNEETCQWEPPISIPENTIPDYYVKYNNYYWDENIINWILEKPFDSWFLCNDNYYMSPIPYPNDGAMYFWDENTLEWISRN